MNTIKGKVYQGIREERLAGGTITPGMLLELAAANTVTAATGEDLRIAVAVALEDELRGKTIADNYAATDLVSIWIPQTGEVFNGILAHTEVAVIGNYLACNGDGKLKVTGTVANAIGLAVKAADATAADARILVMKL